MSGYIHKIGFKVLVDSEVIDFTFNVPRGTLLVQILDELETTLQIKPRIIAVINHYGEIVVIENHYSTIDFLVQKFGTEYYAGETSVVTFNHGEFIVDLEVPVAIPFAATYRTACKSFTLKPIDVAIERQDGQIMDDEVFGMPTAFVLNSWGNFYRIVDKEFGDTLSEVLEQEASIETVPKEPSEPMIYPPDLDKPIPEDQPLVETSPEIDSQIDKMTENFIDSQATSKEPVKSDEPFITQPIEEKKTIYPWEKESTIDKPTSDKEIEELKELIDNLTLDDEIIDEEEVTEQPELASEPVVAEPIIESSQVTPSVDKEVVEEVFKGILADEEREQTIRETPVEEIDKDKIISDDIQEEDILTFDDEASEEEYDFEDEEDEITESYDFPMVEEDEDDDQIIEEHIEELDDIDDEIIDIPAEPALEEIPQELEVTADDDVTSTIESAKELLERVDALTTSIMGDEEAESTAPIIEQPVADEIEGPTLTVPDDDISLNERLEIRKKELTALETALKTQEAKTEDKVSQRSITVEYYERMFPQKIFPLKIKIPPTEKNSGKNTEIKIQPIFPGCHVTPSEEILDIHCDELTEIEFNVTPLVRRGKIAGKVNLWHKKRNLISIVTSSKVLNHAWTYITGTLAFIVGLLPIIIDLIAGTNAKIAESISSSLDPMIPFWIELSLLIVLVGITLGLAFGKKPKIQEKTRKFYPLVIKDED